MPLMARVQGRAALPILAVVFGSIGIVLLVVAGLWAGVRASSIDGDVRAPGTVVDLRGRGHPVIEFSPRAGDVVRFESPIGSTPPRYDIGEGVAVIYPPGDPSVAVLDDFWALWFFPMLAAMIGAPFAVAGGVLSRRARRA